MAVLLLVAVLFVAAGAAWYFGIAERLSYVSKVESTTPQASEELALLALDQDGRFAYSQLNSDERAQYVALLTAFQTREPQVYPEEATKDVARIRDCVMTDHPELFYIEGVQIQTESNQGSGLVTNVQVSGQFTYSEEEVQRLSALLDQAVAECLAGMPAGADDYGKAKYLYEYLARTVEYDHAVADLIFPVEGDGESGEANGEEGELVVLVGEDEAEDGVGAEGPVAEGEWVSDGQTVVDALVGKKALCAGYVRAYQYLLGRLGVPCVYLTGMAGGEYHAWCIAFLDGSWYQIDPTWGDPQYQADDGESRDAGRVDYDYLCLTDADMAATHAVNVPYELPACTNTADNYYVREGLYVTEPDLDQAGALITAALERGDSEVCFRCADWQTYDYLISELFDNQAVYWYYPGDTCSYSQNDSLLTIELFF